LFTTVGLEPDEAFALLVARWLNAPPAPELRDGRKLGDRPFRLRGFSRRPALCGGEPAVRIRCGGFVTPTAVDVSFVGKMAHGDLVRSPPISA
jgi:hypothetical protein